MFFTTKRVDDKNHDSTNKFFFLRGIPAGGKQNYAVVVIQNDHAVEKLTID